MENEKRPPEHEDENPPEIFKPEKEEGKWTFSRRAFLTLAATAAASAAVGHLPVVKDIIGQRVQLIAHATELTQPRPQPGQPLTKIWYFKNNATQSWGEGAVLRFVGAEEWHKVSSIPLPNLEPGQVVPVKVSMVMPANPNLRPVKAAIEVADDELFEIFLPIVHRAPPAPPCTCDADTCACDADTCSCDTDTTPCGCDYDFPCTCDYYFCPCDYEVPCICDYEAPCPCDYEVPCICDYDIPCPCDYDCGCIGYNPCGCVYDFCSCDYYIPCGCVYDYF